jgi:hypothetical protein
MVALYVDDHIIACSHKKQYEKLKNKFQRRFSIKIMGTFKHILGMDVYYDLNNHVIHFTSNSQSRNIISMDLMVN